MKQAYTKVTHHYNTLPRLGKALVKVLLGLCVFIVLLYVGLAWYINTHRKEVLAKITTSLNEDISGTVTVGDMETTFLGGFPGVSLKLKNVLVRDSLYVVHKYNLVEAGTVAVTVNIIPLVMGNIDIKKVQLYDAKAYLYTDEKGYSNTQAFKNNKPRAAKKQGDEEGSMLFRRLFLENVSVTVDNRKSGKLHSFEIHDMKALTKFNAEGWHSSVSLDAFAKSLAFNTTRGSFIKEKSLDGSFEITCNSNSGEFVFEKRELKIGDENFVIGAKIGGKKPSAFLITIENKSILWENAANLLSPNITQKLMMFNIKKPIKVSCTLNGDFDAAGDPLIEVAAEVKDNTLVTPGGDVTGCNFNGRFTNNFVNGKGLEDENSAIVLKSFKGTYNGIPFFMKEARVVNLDKPLASGDFTSVFDLKKLSGFVDDDLLKFEKGTARAVLNFKADVVNFKLTKPLVEGTVNIKDGAITYVPRKLAFNDVSVALDFNKDNLNISEIVLKTKRSVVNMQGRIQNFLNLYYTAPERVVLEWQIYSPKLYLAEFINFLETRKQTQKTIRKNNHGNFTSDIDKLFEKSNVDMKLRVDHVYYEKFHGSAATANVLLTDKGNIILKNAGLNLGGGRLQVNGLVSSGGATNYALSADVKNVDVGNLLDSFDNFGMESLSSKNMQGLITAKADVKGTMNQNGKLLPKSMFGNVNFELKKGKLINFDPIVSVGKFAFPFRDVKNIEFYDLKGNFDVRGEKVTVHPMKINSSVLNMDVQGIYSFGKGTELYIDVPLRNPKKDKDIEDKEKLAERRNKGIVLHLTAEDDEDGKVKVKLGSKG